MGEAPTLENLQVEAAGKQAAYATAQKRMRKEAATAAATPGQVQGRCMGMLDEESVLALGSWL